MGLSEKLIDEFEDVSTEEKIFMKLWNRHSACLRLLLLNSRFHVGGLHLRENGQS